MRLEVMTWKQAERYFQTHDMAVLPIGSIENHGSHLALGTDFLVPSKIAEQLDRESGVLILPAVPYGVADHHGGFPGTISIGYDGLYCGKALRLRCTPIHFSKRPWRKQSGFTAHWD